MHAFFIARLFGGCSFHDEHGALGSIPSDGGPRWSPKCKLARLYWERLNSSFKNAGKDKVVGLLHFDVVSYPHIFRVEKNVTFFFFSPDVALFDRFFTKQHTGLWHGLI